MKMPKLSPREIVMIVFLVILLIAVIYYMAFLTPLEADIAAIETETANLDAQIVSYQEKLAQMNRMEQELKEIKAKPEDELIELAPYDNLIEVVTLLDDFLRQHTEQYSLTHPDPKIGDDGTVRRIITMQLRCDSYDDALAIVRDLTDSKWRCVVTDTELHPIGEAEDLSRTQVNLKITITFYELDNQPKQ